MLLPPVRRSRRGDLGLALSFTTGAVLGAALVVPVVLLFAGLVTPIPASIRVTALLAFAGTATVLTALRGHTGLPQNERQIGFGLISARRPQGSFRFGLLMGTGLFTYLPSPAPHVIAAAAALLLLHPVYVLVLAAGFGAGRGVGLIARSVARDRTGFERRFQRVVHVLRRWVAAPAALAIIGLVEVGT